MHDDVQHVAALNHRMLNSSCQLDTRKQVITMHHRVFVSVRASLARQCAVGLPAPATTCSTGGSSPMDLATLAATQVDEATSSLELKLQCSLYCAQTTNLHHKANRRLDDRTCSVQACMPLGVHTGRAGLSQASCYPLMLPRAA